MKHYEKVQKDLFEFIHGETEESFNDKTAQIKHLLKKCDVDISEIEDYIKEGFIHNITNKDNTKDFNFILGKYNFNRRSFESELAFDDFYSRGDQLLYLDKLSTGDRTHYIEIKNNEFNKVPHFVNKDKKELILLIDFRLYKESGCSKIRNSWDITSTLTMEVILTLDI